MKNFISGITIATITLTTSLTHAAEVIFGVDPVILDLACIPGSTITESISVENKGSDTANFSIDPIGFLNSEVAGTGVLLEKPTASLPPDNLARNITVQPRVIEVPANSTKKTSFTLSVPNTLRGSQYVGLTVAMAGKPGGNLDRSGEYQQIVGTVITAGLNVTIKCHIQGTLQYSYEVKNLELKQKANNQPMKATMIVKNTGNAEMVFGPALILTNESKQIVARLQALKNYHLIPGATETIEFKPSFKDIANGTYGVIVSSTQAHQNLAPYETRAVLK